MSNQENTPQPEGLEAMCARHNDELRQAVHRQEQKMHKLHNEGRARLAKIDAELFDESLEKLVDYLNRCDSSRHHTIEAHLLAGSLRELRSRFEDLEKVTPRGKRGVLLVGDPLGNHKQVYERVYAIVDITEDVR